MTETRIKSLNDKKSDKLFALKIAVFNSIVFLSIAVGDTYIFPSLKTLYNSTPCNYPWGYWVSIVVAPIFLSSYYLTLKLTSLWGKSMLPFLVALIISWIVSFLNFQQSWPPSAQLIAFVQFGWGILATLVRYSDTSAILMHDSTISSDLKRNTIKDQTELWRTIAISGAIGFFGVAVSWAEYISKIQVSSAASLSEQSMLSKYNAFQQTLWATYIILGPVYEVFRLMKRLGDCTFEIAKEAEKKTQHHREKVSVGQK